MGYWTLWSSHGLTTALYWDLGHVCRVWESAQELCIRTTELETEAWPAPGQQILKWNHGPNCSYDTGQTLHLPPPACFLFGY